MKRALLRVGLLGIAAMSSIAGAQVAPDNDAWGEAVDGVQLHLALATTAPPPLPGKLPVLEVVIRNRGPTTVTADPEALVYANVEIDDVWYWQAGLAHYGSVRPIDIAPGGQSDVWRMDILGFWAANSDGGFEPPAGQHRVRIRNLTTSANTVILRNAPAGDGKTLELVSNRIVVDVPEWSASAERAALIARTSAGGYDYLADARQLVEKYPEAALPAIVAGAAASTDPDARADYVELADTIPGDGVIPFLLTQIAPDIPLRSRISAAAALLARGRDEGLWSLMDTWRYADLDRAQFPDWARMLELLVRSGNPQVLDLLGRMPETTADIRMAIVKVLIPSRISDGKVLERGQRWPFSVSVRDNSGPDIPGGIVGGAEAERFLGSVLDDCTSIPYEMEYEGKTYTRSRVCDMAALALSQRWPEKYRFAWFADAAARDQQIAVMKATWRNP